MFIVYGKKRTDKRYKPFNMRDNKFVVNLIHASLFQENDKERLEKEVNYMNQHNADYIFEIRKQS